MSTPLPVRAEDYWVVNVKVFKVVSFNILETGKFVVSYYDNVPEINKLK